MSNNAETGPGIN